MPPLVSVCYAFGQEVVSEGRSKRGLKQLTTRITESPQHPSKPKDAASRLIGCNESLVGIRLQDNWRFQKVTVTSMPSRSTIVDDHGQLITWAVRKLNVPIDALDDARQGGAVGLLTALDRFDPSKGRYRSYAASHVLQEVRTAVGWTRRHYPSIVDLVDQTDFIAEDTQAQFDRADQADAIADVQRFAETLNALDHRVYERTYRDQVSQTDLAAELGTNKMSISRRLAKIHTSARAFLSAHSDAA